MIGSRHSKYMDISLFCYNQGAMDDVGSAAFQWAQYGPIGSLTIGELDYDSRHEAGQKGRLTLGRMQTDVGVH